MNKKRTIRFGWKGLLGASLLVVGLLAYQQGAAATALATVAATASATAQVRQAWENVQFSASYAFNADVTIETIPLATVGNIGRFSKSDSLYLEGVNDLADDALELVLWGGAVSATDRANAYQMRAENGRIQTRAGDGPWQNSADSAIAFAPAGDFMAFIEMAANVQVANDRAPAADDAVCATLDCEQLTVYTFDVNSRAYAERLTRLAQEQMIRAGELPPGAGMQVPDHLAKIDGAGELWVDARGLPVRQQVTLAIPPAPGADYSTTTAMDIRFTNYAEMPLTMNPWQRLTYGLTQLELPAASDVALGGGAFAFTLLSMVVLVRPRRGTLMFTNVAILVIILVTPLLQVTNASAAARRANATQTITDNERAVQNAALDLRASVRAASPYTPPALALTAPAAATALDANLDSDGDGLTDAVEELIGTNLYSDDTDFDEIKDGVEVTGFSYSGKTWYGNPRLADSNQDGVLDALEWNPAAPDSDGDGAPDLYDYDDDGDGVPDDVDVSRLIASKDNSGALVAFSASNPLTLTVDGLQPNRYTYVNLQLRPTNPNQLWYAFNVLNWPKDEKGSMQDWDNKTFFDACVAAGGGNCQMTPDANGDIKFVPMLEVQVKDLSSLPRTAGGALDKDLLAQYGTTVQPDGSGGYYLYTPLNLVEDRVTGEKVAFNAQLLYQSGATWQPQQVRVSWAVQALNEQYVDADAANKALADGRGTGENKNVILHAYYADFHLTGLNVREDRGVQMAILYEDPATDLDVTADDALTHMMGGLGNSYMINRDCDLTDNAGNCIGDGQRDITIPVIKQRWDSASNSGVTDGQRWGIPANGLRVETYSFAHEDAATMIGGGQYAPAILNGQFTGKAATASLLFVREGRSRAFNIDARAAGASGIVWTGRNVQLNLANINELITGGFNLAPYKYVSASNSWTVQTPEEVVQTVEERYPLTDDGANTAPIVTTGQQAAIVVSQITGVQGEHAVLSQNGQTGLAAALTSGGAIRLQAADIRDEDLRRIYAQALASGIGSVPYLALNAMVKGLNLTEDAWEDLVKLIFNSGAYKTVGSQMKYRQNLYDPDNFIKSLQFERGANLVEVSLIGRYRQVLVGPMLVGMAVGFLLTNVKGGETAGQVMLSTLTALNDTLDAVTTYRAIASNLRGLGVTNPGVILQSTLNHSFSLTSTVAKAAAVGAVIGVAATWAFFFAAWGKGGLAVDSVEFNSLLAGAIAATLVIVLTFIISLSVVGAIVMAVFGVFDLLFLIICKAGAKAACSLGITEAITKLITDWIYTGSVMIQTTGDPAITNVEDIEMRLTKPELGPVVGNSMRYRLDLLTWVRHKAPEPGIIYHYPSFFTTDDLRSTSVNYGLATAQSSAKPELNQQRDSWYVRSFGWVEAEVPSPVVGWLVPTVKSKDLFEGLRRDVLYSPLYDFTSAKINQTFPLYLNTGLALPRYDCWFQVCTHKVAKSAVSTDLGKKFVLDILPATLDGFYGWSELGMQTDFDGDGVPFAIDPNQNAWDADGDGVPDGVELKLKNGSKPLLADADGDGLNDARELRHRTNPNLADSDRDGINDFDEVNGYQLTFGGRSVHVTSDPNARDGDGDGMSDGVERRLNLLDPVTYPFHPAVLSDTPLRLFTELDDADAVLAIGAQTTVTATVLNDTAVSSSLLAAGAFTASLPSELGGASAARAFTLLPATSDAIALVGVAAAGQRFVNVNVDAGADLVAIGSPLPTGPASDIIIDDALPVTIDNDDPDAPALTLGYFVQPDTHVVIGGTASDPTSYIALVEVNVNNAGFSPATGTGAWAFTVAVPNAPTGSTIPIVVRATDAVGHVKSANFSLTIDGAAPSATIDLTPGAIRTLRRNADGDWTLALSGTATDGLAGVASVTVQIGVNANAVITPGGLGVGGAWSLVYPFDDIATNADPHPTGPYTLTLTTRDNALPDGNPNTQVIPFIIDMTPPVVELLSHPDDEQLTDGAMLTGTVQDAYAAVAGVEYAFVDAATVLETEETLLHLPLNDLPETVLFSNNANTPTRIFCLDESCPTSGVAGTDGTAAQFDGVDDMLRSFEPLDLPESGLTTAFWFKTIAANAGLFSAIAGQYPAVTGHDRDLYLAAGTVCADVQTGVGVETRCTVDDSFADGQWHQVVHTLGANGNHLYLDGVLAVSSPTTASTFAAQERVLVGYAPAAGQPFLNGALDDVIIYNGALSANAVAALYRRWQPATLVGGQWSFTVPAGIEGYYQIDMRATDSVGNRTESRGDWPQFRGPVDTKLPTFDVAASYRGSGSSAQTVYRAAVNDFNLITTNYDFVCPLAPEQLVYASQPSDKLNGIAAQCTRAGFQTSLVAASACDALGHCAAAAPPQTVAYIGTQENTLAPFGSLPNAIERANLSNPRDRVRLIERPGQVIVDIAVDELHGKLYWAEMTQGDYAQPGGVWRANLDGSNIQQVVSGLTVYGAEALQIALDPGGNKLYWTKGHELWWANLDGTLKQIVYSIPPDPGYVDGAFAVMQIGDVTVDTQNGRLYLSERRQRGNLADYNTGIRAYGQIFKHTLIVTADLNGANPAFFAGAGAGCTYQNYYDNLGYGVDAGQDPTLCLTAGTDGFDVEALAVSNGTLYWSAIDSNGVTAGVYGRTPGQAAFTVAPLALPGNNNGLRTGPLPHLHVDADSLGVFVQVGAEIVRGERDGEFTQFTSFRDDTPAPAGGTRRASSSLTALAVIQTPQVDETDTDLAVAIASRSLVVVDGGGARYDITLRNDAALPAADTVLTLTLPAGATYTGSSVPCTAGGASVTCAFVRFGGLTQQTLGISFTVATAEVRVLTGTVTVGATTADRNTANNTASHSRITAAPTLTSLPGLPYLYYGNLTELTRVPLFTAPPNVAEPLFLDPPMAGAILASDPARDNLFMVDGQDKLVVVKPDGSGRLELANTNAAGLNTSDRQRVAVNEATGRVYWSEITTLYLTAIKSANPDGTGVTTVITNVLNQRGLLVDPIRSKLLWVGSDTWQRQELIFTSDLDGGNKAVVYAAPAGMQLRELALDPYTQKLYWLDPTFQGGALFWADADGTRIAALATNLGSDARGLVVRPLEDALYYVRGNNLVRANLDGSDPQTLADLSQRAYTGLRLPVAPTSFSPTYINRPSGNLVFLIATPFAAPPCAVNDGHEPNNSAGAATAIGVGVTSGALCTTDASLPQDRDFYTVTVPTGQQLTATLSGLPANYDLYVQRAGVTLAISQSAGLADETIALANYEGDRAYTIVVFSNAPGNNVAPYTLTVSLADAPPQTVFNDIQCLMVDPADAAGLAGNYQQSQATPLTVGSVITGALCYQNDIDFFAFTATTGQRLTLDLPERPADYELHLYRPDGTFYNAFNPTGVWSYPAQVSIDATGMWAVAVRLPTLTPTLSPYQLLVTDSTCSINDPWEPNNAGAQAASLGAPGRVHATLCAANDVDNYRIAATAGQTLTVNYPANAAGAVLRLLSGAGAEVGRILPGNQGNFVLPATGDYTLVAANSTLTTTDTPYMFQWLLDAPQVAPDKQYLYYTNGLPGQLYRVALSADHTTEPIFLTTTLATAGPAIVADGARNLLYSYNPLHEGDGYIVRSNTDPFDGSGYTTVVTAPNLDGVGVPPVAVAVDEITGRIYWVQPRGAIASTGSTIRRANGDGTDNVAIIGAGVARTSLLVDSIRGLLYWTENGAIMRSDLDGANVTTLRAAAGGQTPTDLALDPFAQRLYWLDTTQRTLYRANADGSNVAALVTGLDASARGVAVQPRVALYYSSGGVMLQAALDGSNPLTITALAGAYNGPSNLDPNAFPLAAIAPPQSQLTIGSGRPLVSPCTLADSHEPNNDPGSATPLTVVTATVTYGALCNSVLGQPADWDYYTVTVASQKILSVTLSELPANYRVIVRNDAGFNLAFSDNDGLADEAVAVGNTSSTTATYTILVLGYGLQNTNQYKLTLELGDVPPPPGPSDEQCSFVDVYDTPETGNGTLATATPLPFDALLTAALCYTADVDMYSFDGLNGQTLTIDLPLRPQDYNLTLYDPSGAATAVISATTTPAYGGSVTLTSSGRYTVSVSQPNLTPTEAQYQLLVSDENCVASDGNEPNDSAAFATPLADGSRVRATLCSASDVDLYAFSATSGQQLTLNYPANQTGAVARVVAVTGGAELGQVTAGGQGIFNIPADGDYRVVVENATLAGSAVPYQFELLVGAPTTPPGGSPYIYYSRVSDLVRTAVVTGTVEPILLPDTFGGGSVLASDPVRSKLYILDYAERIVRANPDGSEAEVVVANTDPYGVLRYAESLAVDERSGRIYWVQPRFGVVGDIKSANGDGTDVQTVVTDVVYDHGIAVDPVGGWLYWAEEDTYRGVNVIRRSNLDGTEVQTVYAALEGRQIRELTVDPFAQTLYWRDPTQNRLLQTAADGSGAVVTVANVGSARGFVVRPLQNELYYTADSQLWRAARDGSNPVALARLDGAYNGVSNLDIDVFYPTILTPPGSNLALAFGAPFVERCRPVDSYEPNNTLATAVAIAPGSLSAALCTDDLTNPDNDDYYKLTVASGQQITVTLTDLPHSYGLTLIANGNFVTQSIAAGTADKVLTHSDRTGAPVTYTILVSRNGAPGTRLPYTLDVEVAVAPPPTDSCAPFDVYDAPGALGNQTSETATPITVGSTITAALCYDGDADYYAFSGDVDYYAFDGIVGQQVTVDLSPRPADYDVNFYNPAGQLVTRIFPGSPLTYTGSFVLNAAGRWTVAVYDFPNPTPTTDQYALRLSSPTCTGLDPYEPNNVYYTNAYTVSATTATLRTMLCGTEDQDWYKFALGVGDRIRITPRVLTNGTNSSGVTVNMNISIQPPGSGFGEITEPYEMIASSAGDFRLGVYTQPRVDNNLRYEIDVQVTPAPARPTPPNNWTCTVYPSSDIPRGIEDLTTLASTVNVTASGSVTWVGLKDITLDHGGPGDVSFGLAAPDGAQVDLFAFRDYGGSYFGCGSGSNCQLSIDDWAIEGLAPPTPPNDGGTFQPSRNSFAPFNGKASNGVWTLLVTDNFLPEPGDEDAGDTTGDLFGWSLEVCVDNGAEPDPTPTATPAPTLAPRTEDGAPPAAVAPPVVIATPTPPVCAATPDAFENDDSVQTAGLFDTAVGSSAGHNFHTAADTDWYTVTLAAGLQYTLTAVTVNPAQVVALSLYATDVITPLRTQAGTLTYTPTVSSRYLVRAASGSGLGVSLCDSEYSLVLTSYNPNDVPAPLPVGGAALPPGHVAPPRSAAVLNPADGAVFTATQPITVAVGLNAEAGIGSAALFVEGAAIASYTAPVSTTDTVYQTNWTPPGAGSYRFTAVITDSLNVTATSPTNVVYVDLAGPTVIVVSETITVARLASDGSYLLRGTATDDSQIDKVEVQLDSGPWQLAQIDGNNWSLAIAPGSLANPNGGNLAIQVRATDKAGRTASAAANVLVDVTPPAAFASTASLVSSGALISPSQVITELNVRLSWPAITGAVSVHAGWTNAVTPTLGSLTAYGAGAGAHDQLMPEASAMYAHVVAVDINSNQTAYSQGPFYFDTAATPDVIADLAQENWVESGGKQVGQMSTPARSVQKLFAGWDDDHLRLRWEGFNVDSEGDLYFYLGKGGSGTTDLFNPYGANQSNVLPFAANYLVHVAGGITPTLYSASGGAWAMQAEAAAVTSGQLTDVLLPFADLGIANPAATNLKLLGVASTAGTLDVWATAPDQNLGRPWAQYVEFSALGAGIVPAAGVWADAPIEVIGVTADPSPAQLVGAGDAIAVTVLVQNVGSVALPAVTVNGAAAGGVALTNAPQVANNLAPSGTVALTLLGTVSSDGSLAVTLADSYHRPYALETLTYTVDAAPPVSVTLVVSYVTPGSNSVLGFAQDDSPIGLFELEVGGGATTSCTAGGTAGAYACTFDAGAVADGASLTLNVRATDVHGNASGWNSFPVVVDATPPQLALSAAAQSALSDGRLSARELSLSGTVTDTVAANGAELCTDNASNCTQQGVLPDASWTLFAPSLGDGVTATLAFLGYDLAGNASQPVSVTVLVDTVAPQLGPTTVNPGIILSGTAALLASGTVTDGGGIAAINILLVKPDRSSTVVPANVVGGNWWAPFFFDQTGEYAALVVARDLAGNLAAQSLDPFIATALPQPALLTVNVVGSGAVTPTTGIYIPGMVVPVMATAAAGWSFAGWSGDVASTANPISVTVSGDKIITATFAQDVYTVTTAVVGGGAITLTPAQASYRYGDVVTATAVANAAAVFAGWHGAATGLSNPITLTVDSSKMITAAFTARRLLVHPAQPGVLPGNTVAISATVLPPQAGLVVSFTVADGGGSLNLASATTNESGRAAVLYTAPFTNALVQIDGLLAAAPVITDSGYLYVSAAALPVGGKIEPSVGGVYTVGNLVDNLIEIVKVGDGAPVMGWSVFTGNPCPASTPGGSVITPYVDVMVDGAASDDVIVVTLRYTGTLATRPRPYWCDNGTWQPITGTVAVSSAGSTLVFTLTNASSPTIFQLQGTPFTGVDSPPTAASVDGFAAEALPDRVRLTWQTLSEVGLTGFHLYRGTDPAGPGDRITGDPLPAQGMGALEGFAYSYEDLTSRLGDKTLYYWLEELRSDGAPVRHGPRIIAGAEGLRVFLPLVTQNPQAAEGEPEQEPPADSPPAEEPPDAAAGLTPGVYLPLITQQ